MKKEKVNWREYLEIVAKAVWWVIAVLGGFLLVDEYELGVIGKIVFWPTWLIVFYWVVIRESYIPRKSMKQLVPGAVVIEFPLQEGEHGSQQEISEIHELAGRLELITNKNGLGEYDGDEFGAGKCKLFFFTDKPDEVFEYIERELRDSNFSDGMKASLTRPGKTKAFREIEF